MSTSPTFFTLPKTLNGWPWPRRINPHYEVVKKETNEWIHSFKAFDEKAQKAFDLCDFQRIAALTNFWQDKENFWTCAALMVIFFVFDERSDCENAVVVRGQADMIMDALRSPNKARPDGENVMGEIFRQFWARAIKSTTPIAQKIFIDAFQLYTDSVVDQAADRDVGRIRTIDEYFVVRRKTIGAEPSFVLMQLDVNLPEEVMEHPVIKQLSLWTIDLIILDNDMCSYNVEQARGDDGHNVITIVMHHLNIDLSGALKWIADYHAELSGNVIRCVEHIPWTYETSPEVARYVEGLLNWPRANDCWNFESHRYFGSEGLEIQLTRTVKMLPKRK